MSERESARAGERGVGQTQPEDESRSDQQATGVPQLSEWSSVMDELIEDAMRQGHFDNLAGWGRPLNLRGNPYGGDTELSYQLLKNNDYTLPWITARRVVQEEVGAFRDEIKETWALLKGEYQAARSETVRMSLSLGWERHQEQWRVQIGMINQRIADANLKLPAEKLEIVKLSLQSELKRAGAAEKLGD